MSIRTRGSLHHREERVLGKSASNRWVAIDAAASPTLHAQELRFAWELFLGIYAAIWGFRRTAPILATRDQ